jgi:hypothetical protein
VALGQHGHQGEQGAADGGGEARDPDAADRLGPGLEVCPGGADGGQDADCVLAQTSSGRSEPHATTDGFDQRSARLTSKGSDLLGDRGRGDSEVLRDLTHRPQAAESHQHVETTWVHRHIVH